MTKLNQFMIAGALSVGLLSAQGRGPGGGTPPDPAAAAQMRVDHLNMALSLTDAQKAQALTIFTNAITASQTVQSNLRANRQSIADAVKKNDTASIDQLSSAAGALSGQLTSIDAKANAAFYTILTPDQQTKYDATPHGGPRGFGGPMSARVPRH